MKGLKKSVKQAFPGGLYHKRPTTALRTLKVKANLREGETAVTVPWWKKEKTEQDKEQLMFKKKKKKKGQQKSNTYHPFTLKFRL